jgi:hypothetical protein
MWPGATVQVVAAQLGGVRYVLVATLPAQLPAEGRLG